MGTVRAQRQPLPQVQKLLVPLQERERALQHHLQELQKQLDDGRGELGGLRREIQELLDWEPPAHLLDLYAEGRLNSRTPSESCSAHDVHSVETDETEEEDFFYDCEDEDEAEPAPQQPDDPLSAVAANEEERVFAIIYTCPMTPLSNPVLGLMNILVRSTTVVPSATVCQGSPFEPCRVPFCFALAKHPDRPGFAA